MTTRPTLDELRSALAVACDALGELAGVLHQAHGAELAAVLGEVDHLAALAGAARCEVTAEAVQRGVPADSGDSTEAWVRGHAPSLGQSGVKPLAALVDRVCAGSALTGQAILPDPDTPLGLIWARVHTGEVAPPLAMATLAEIERLATRLVSEAIPTVTTALLDLGTAWGPALMRRLRPRLLAEHGLPGEFDDEHNRLRRVAFLSSPDPESGDLTMYRMGLTPEQAAALEAAVGPLAAPQPNEETGERDLRPHGQRRVEALIELCDRATSVDVETRNGPSESTSTLYVTVDVETLRAHMGAGEVLGSSANGTLLSPEALRKLCCDADLIPVVLGTDSQPLDYGRIERLFTRAQRRAIWRRDRTCTYPGCHAPGAWTKVHHVHHWVDGGRSDLDNAALLCQRHHTFVHTRRLWAEVRSKPDDHGRYVVWDLTPGSYDSHVHGTRTESPWAA